MCFQTFTHYRCGHSRVATQKCDQATDNVFYMPVACTEYSHEVVHLNHECGTGKYYCSQGFEGPFLDHVHDTHSTVLLEVRMLDERLADTMIATRHVAEMAYTARSPQDTAKLEANHKMLELTRNDSQRRKAAGERITAEAVGIITVAQQHFIHNRHNNADEIPLPLFRRPLWTAKPNFESLLMRTFPPPLQQAPPGFMGIPIQPKPERTTQQVQAQRDLQLQYQHRQALQATLPQPPSQPGIQSSPAPQIPRHVHLNLIEQQMRREQLAKMALLKMSTLPQPKFELVDPAPRRRIGRRQIQREIVPNNEPPAPKRVRLSRNVKRETSTPENTSPVRRSSRQRRSTVNYAESTASSSPSRSPSPQKSEEYEPSPEKSRSSLSPIQDGRSPPRFGYTAPGQNLSLHRSGSSSLSETINDWKRTNIAETPTPEPPVPRYLHRRQSGAYQPAANMLGPSQQQHSRNVVYPQQKDMEQSMGFGMPTVTSNSNPVPMARRDSVTQREGTGPSYTPRQASYEDLRRSFSATANLTPPSDFQTQESTSDPRKRKTQESYSPHPAKRLRLSLPGEGETQVQAFNSGPIPAPKLAPTNAQWRVMSSNVSALQSPVEIDDSRTNQTGDDAGANPVYGGEPSSDIDWAIFDDSDDAP